MNQQREVIYSLRLFALERGEELKAEARRMIEAALERAVTQFLADVPSTPEEWDRGGLREALTLQYLVTVDALTDAEATPSIDKMVERTKAEGEETFRRKIEYLAEFGRTIGIPDVDSQVLSQVMLNVLDERWKDHLYDLDQLRNAIQYRAWGQKDPLVEYKREAFEMFEDLMHDIQSTFTERFLKIQVSAERPEPPRAAPPPPPPAAAVHPSAPTSGADDLFMGPPPRVPPPPPWPRGGPAPALTSSLGRSAGRRRPCRRWGGTIRVRAGRGRSTRSATGWGGSSTTPLRPCGADGPPLTDAAGGRIVFGTAMSLCERRSPWLTFRW